MSAPQSHLSLCSEDQCYGLCCSLDLELSPRPNNGQLVLRKVRVDFPLCAWHNYYNNIIMIQISFKIRDCSLLYKSVVLLYLLFILWSHFVYCKGSFPLNTVFRLHRCVFASHVVVMLCKECSFWTAKSIFFQPDLDLIIVFEML